MSRLLIGLALTTIGVAAASSQLSCASGFAFSQGTHVPDLTLQQAKEVDLLIHELPVEDAHPIVNDSYPSVFDADGGTGPSSPAHKLAKFGLPAVPKLIQALADTRPTATKGWRYSLTVSDVSLQILQQIAGVSFVSNTRVGIPHLQAEVSAWFADLKRDGEFAVLRSRLAPDVDYRAADTIFERYPSEAVAAVAVALARTPNWRNRETLVDTLDRHRNQKDVDRAPIAEILRHEAKTGSNVSLRVDAATHLAETDKKAAAEILVKEFRQFRGPDETWGGFAREQFIAPLLSVCDPDADRCLVTDFANRTVNYRAAVVGMDGLLFFVKQAPRPDAKALEQILVGELDDNATQCHNFGFGQQEPNAEIGDIAAFSLSKLLPDKYPPNSLTFRSDRRRHRFEFENIWRASKGLPSRPLTSLPLVQAETPDTVTAVLISGETPEQKQTADLARSLKSKQLTYSTLKSLWESASKNEFPKLRYTRILAGRDAPNGGITLRVDFNLRGFAEVGSKPGQSFSGAHMYIESRLVSTYSSGNDIVALNKDAIESCLATSLAGPFEMELDVWWSDGWA